MKHNKKTGIIATICSILIVVIVVGIVSNTYSITLAEAKYRLNPTDENLVKLSVLLASSKEHEKMKEYLPLVIKIDDLKGIIVENDWYCIGYDGNYAAANTAETIIVMSALSYILAEDYEGFNNNFPYIYTIMFEEDVCIMWDTILTYREHATNEGYDYILQELEEQRHKPTELKLDARDEAFEYVFNLNLTLSVLQVQGEQKEADEIKQQITEFSDAYIKSISYNNDVNGD